MFYLFLCLTVKLLSTSLLRWVDHLNSGNRIKIWKTLDWESLMVLIANTVKVTVTHFSLTQFWTVFPYYIALEHKIFDILVFSGSSKWEGWSETGSSCWNNLSVCWELYFYSNVPTLCCKILEVSAYLSNIMPSQFILGILIVKLTKHSIFSWIPFQRDHCLI